MTTATFPVCQHFVPNKMQHQIQCVVINIYLIPECTNTFQADVMFGIHGIGGDSRVEVREFVKEIGGAFRAAPNVRIGLSENCNSAEIELQGFQEEDTFAVTVSQAMATSATATFNRVRLSYGRARTDVNRIAILIVAGEIEDFEMAKREVARLKYSSRVIVVGVGERVDVQQLRELSSYEDASDISHVFPVRNPESLTYVVRKILDLMCRESQ